MSEKKQLKENTEQKEQKVVTKYDLKMQRRKEEKEREERQQRINNVIGVVVVIALVCLVASFPIRTYLALHETYVRINGEDISRVEFDYNYNLAKTNYLNEYGYYLSYYFGYDITADPATQMYTENLTLKDYYENMAVDALKQNKALLAQAKAEGFTYNTSEEYTEYEEALKEAASANGLSEKRYVQEQYGSYATKSRIKKYVEESMYLNAYYEHLTQVKAPTDEEIEAYYKENPDSYDSVDYRLSIVYAELPTEPTELADTTNSADGNNTDAAAAYEPSQEEIAKAMADAREKANALEPTVAQDGEQCRGRRMSTADSAIRSWLFESARKAGDTTVIEDASSNCYYVVAFESRYRNDNLPVNVRVLTTTAMDGQTILDEWNSGEATEESFAELCRKYSEDSTAENGGLYENLSGTDMNQEIAEWTFDGSRKQGDVTSIIDEYGETYVLYYIGTGEGDPGWKAEAKSSILSETMSNYLAEITDAVQVEDPNGKLNYLKVQAEEEAAAASEEADASQASGAESEEQQEETESTSEGTEAAGQ